MGKSSDSLSTAKTYDVFSQVLGGFEDINITVLDSSYVNTTSNQINTSHHVTNTYYDVYIKQDYVTKTPNYTQGKTTELPININNDTSQSPQYGTSTRNILVSLSNNVTSQYSDNVTTFEEYITNSDNVTLSYDVTTAIYQNVTSEDNGTVTLGGNVTSGESSSVAWYGTRLAGNGSIGSGTGGHAGHSPTTYSTLITELVNGSSHLNANLYNSSVYYSSYEAANISTFSTVSIRDYGLIVNSTSGGETGMEVTFPCNSYSCLDYLDGVVYNLSDTQLQGSHEDGSHWHVLLLLLVVVAGITGNVLVCIAVSVEKKLQNVTNYFLVSLAVADLFVSLIVMPCSIVHELVGYWPFGLVMCDLWQVTDVMMCTSSIMHMCTISLDRYIAIRHPLKVRNKSRTVVGIKIATVWFISLAIASPIILLSLLNPENVLYGGDCAIFNRYFLIYGSLAAFFIPLLIMLIAYSLTIHILHKQAKLCAKKSKSGVPIMRRSTSQRNRKKSHNTQDKDKNNASNGLRLARKIQSHLDRNRASPSEKEPLAGNRGDIGIDTESPVIARLKADANSTAPDNPAKPRLQALVKKHSAAIKVAGILIAKRQENEKNHLNNVKTERKAVKVLGTMFGIFVICWGPFFSLNFAMGVCESCNIEVTLFKVFLWCGYVSSTLNPIIYTVFNKTFKQTFLHILACKCSAEDSQPSYNNSTGNGATIRVKLDHQISCNTTESML